MPVRRTKKLAIIQRRQKVADLYLQGWTQQEIGDHLGVNQKTASSDLKWIRQEWRESAVRDFDEARETELRKIDRVEREAWAAWERSQKPAQSAQFNDEANQRKARRQVRNQYGDPRFLEQVNKCIASRCALLGLNTMPMETDTDGQSIVDRRDRIVTVIAALRERAGAAADGAGSGAGESRLLCADRERGAVDAGPAPGLS